MWLVFLSKEHLQSASSVFQPSTFLSMLVCLLNSCIPIQATLLAYPILALLAL